MPKNYDFQAKKHCKNPAKRFPSRPAGEIQIMPSVL